MSGVYDLAARFMHRFDPEQAHVLTIRALKIMEGYGIGRKRRSADRALSTQVAGLDLPNPIGLAAGFDKNAEVPDAMLGFGFGFAECGTVTPFSQLGNDKPRLFRLSEDRAVINRMGFNNEGLEAFAGRLRVRRQKGRKGIVGANIGANKDSGDRIGDYVTGLAKLWGLPDYFTANISSPNTPGLRNLQSRDMLDDLLGRLSETRKDLQKKQGGRAPIFLKIAPDLSEAEIRDAVEACLDHGIDGLIVSNTTLDRPASLQSAFREESGGLSGAPLKEKSLWALRIAAACGQKRLPLIAAGGVETGGDAYVRIRAGASLVQLYSAMVYEGPGIAERVLLDLSERLKADGISRVRDAVGLDL